MLSPPSRPPSWSLARVYCRLRNVFKHCLVWLSIRLRAWDSLPAEFYLKLWHVLGQDLVDVLNSCYVAGSLTLSQHQGSISLSFKKGD